MSRFDAVFDEPLRARFDAIKGKFKGERCFCVGNGPSLANTPLELLKDEYTFGLNRIAKIYPTTSWRPTFYVNVTRGVIGDSEWGESAREAIKNTPSFLCVDFLPALLEKVAGDVPTILVPHDVYPLRVTCRQEQTSPDVSVWSDDIFERVSKDGSSMLAVMQIAAYMGFDTIVLIGCDLGWRAFDWEKNIDPNHFCEDYWGWQKIGGRKIEMTETVASNCNYDVQISHLIAKHACDSLGIKVYNATVGGGLETYPRVDFVETVKRKPWVAL